MFSSLDLNTLLEGLISIRGAVFLAGKAALFTAAYLGYSFSAGVFSEDKFKLPEFRLEQNQIDDASKSQKLLDEYKIISSRNIFGPGRKKVNPEDGQVVKAAELKLRLVGTNIGANRKPFAIIENEKSEQDVFDLGEDVFGQAKLMEVFPDKVKVEFNGSIETLTLEDDISSGSNEISGNDEGTSFSVPEDELNENLANLPRLLSQARAVPYFRDGQSIGMRLFAIRQDSLYQKLGLMNGDILLSVGGNSLSDPTQALKLFELLKSERSIKVNVERSGVEKEIDYTIE